MHLILLQLISWEVDLMGVDPVGSWSTGSWFSGSWFRESWSRGPNSIMYITVLSEKKIRFSPLTAIDQPF